MTWHELDPQEQYVDVLDAHSLRPHRPGAAAEDVAARAYGLRRFVREIPGGILELSLVVPGDVQPRAMYFEGDGIWLIEPGLTVWMLRLLDERGQVLADEPFTTLQEAVQEVRKRAYLVEPTRTPNAYTPSTVPERYLEGLSGRARKARQEEIARRSKEAEERGEDPDELYREFETDYVDGERIETKESKHTKNFKAIYGDNAGGSVAKVAKATKLPKALIQDVYDRGLAAWRTGHAPGATGPQWGLARVYSFVTGGKTWQTADADLAKVAKSAGFKPGGKATRKPTRRRKANDLEGSRSASDYPPGYGQSLERYVVEHKSYEGPWSLEYHVADGLSAYCHLPDRVLVVDSVPAGVFALRFVLRDGSRDGEDGLVADETYEVVWDGELAKDAKLYRRMLREFLADYAPAEASQGRKTKRKVRSKTVDALRG